MPESAAVIEWGIAGRALRGELESGDIHIVEPFPGGVLVGMVDALGHGPEAAEVARLARATLQARASAPVAILVQYCHQALRTTRGAVMTVVSFDANNNTLSWLGIGNVDAHLFHADALMMRRREAIMPRGGVVGHNLPKANATTISVTPGDILILATDGISSRFVDIRYSGSPQEIAADILAQYGKATDDALVLVARYDGYQQ